MACQGGNDLALKINDALEIFYALSIIQRPLNSVEGAPGIVYRGQSPIVKPFKPVGASELSVIGRLLRL